jgi:AcrR family transcriptional regulator
MSESIQGRTAGFIVQAVIGLLESDGYDAVSLREVARRAHVSLATIYKLFPTRSNGLLTRDELIVTAVEQWLASGAYADLAPPDPNERLYDGLMRMLRYVFEPWEKSPRMLEAYYRVRGGPGGERVRSIAVRAVTPVGEAVLEGRHPVYVQDVGLILTNLVDAVIAKFAEGELEVSDVLPTLERAVFRLTTNNQPVAGPLRTRRPNAGEPAQIRRQRPARIRV